MSDSSTTILGNIINPTSVSQPDNAEAPLGLGRQSEQLVSEIHGKYYTSNYRGKMFWVNVTAVTVPVIASGLVSVLSLYNPVGSGVNLELVDFDIGLVLATTVVDVVGLYYSTAPLTAKGTFTTQAGVANQGAGIIGSPVGGQGQAFTAYTHSGTPVRAAILASFGATTDPTSQIGHYDFDGKIIIPPGIVVSVAASTAALTSSGTDMSLRWMEWPA